MRIQILVSTALSLFLASCATVDKWFAPDVESAEHPQMVVNNSDDAEREIDPEKEKNDAALMGTALVQPTSMQLASETKPAMSLNQTQTQTESESDTNQAAMPQNKTTFLTAQRNMAERKSNRVNSPRVNQQTGLRLNASSMPQFLSNEDTIKSGQQKLLLSVENDYETFRALNHQFIKNNTPKNQYRSLDQLMSHFAMDLVANLSPEHYGAPLVVRPMKLKVTDVANPEGGKELITSLLASQMKDYGFQVYDGRKPKGRFTGEEVILETVIDSYGDQFVLYGTLTVLKSNIVAGSHNTFISDFFFRNIKDGVEVYGDGANF